MFSKGEIVTIKQIAFRPWQSGGQIKIVYCTVGDEVYFSSITPPHEAPTSVNCASQIVAEISRLERLRPNKAKFYDMQTHKGYSDLEPGECRISELEVVASSQRRISIRRWIPLEIPPGYPIPEGFDLTGISPEIKAMFNLYIGEVDPNTPPWNLRLFRSTFGGR